MVKFNVHIEGKTAERVATLKAQGVPVSKVVDAALNYFLDNCKEYSFPVSRRVFTQTVEQVSIKIAK